MRLHAFSWFIVFAVGSAAGQGGAAAAAATEQNASAMHAAATAGAQINTVSNVSDSLNIEAVLLPSAVTKHVFGKYVAENYAVIEVNVANRNANSAFILHSLYIDYGDWALAQGYDLAGSQQGAATNTARTSSSQVSSVEYRIIRGEVMDRQPFTPRNLIVNTLKGIGSAGTAFAFPFSADVARGISAWNGGVVPALEAYWPDSTQGWMNRISDFGFRNNKVVPQQSADIVVAFFPISRFLPQSLKRLFLDDPAAFFSPVMLALDPNQKGLNEILRSALGNDQNVHTARKALLQTIANADASDLTLLSTEIGALDRSIMRDRQQLLLSSTSDAAAREAEATEITARMKGKKTQLDALTTTLKTKFSDSSGFTLFQLLTALSLSRVSIVVSGTMNADEQSIPASIRESCFDKAPVELWGEPGAKTCVLRGQYLLNGIPKIVESTPTDLGVTDIAVKSEASSSDLLTFTYKLKEAIDPPQFSIVVTKSMKNGTSVDSMKYAVAPRSTMLTAKPEVASGKTTGSGATTSFVISGSNYFSIKPNNILSIDLKPKAGNAISITDVTRDSSTQLTLAPAALQKLANGCYAVTVKEGALSGTSALVYLKVADAPGSTKAISTAEKCD